MPKTLDKLNAEREQDKTDGGVIVCEEQYYDISELNREIYNACLKTKAQADYAHARDVTQLRSQLKSEFYRQLPSFNEESRFDTFVDEVFNKCPLCQGTSKMNNNITCLRCNGTGLRSRK